MSYKIIRYYQDPHKSKRTIDRGLTLEAAQAHCQNPETSSKTATGKTAKAITRRNGPWFEGYQKE